MDGVNQSSTAAAAELVLGDTGLTTISNPQDPVPACTGANAPNGDGGDGGSLLLRLASLAPNRSATIQTDGSPGQGGNQNTVGKPGV